MTLHSEKNDQRSLRALCREAVEGLQHVFEMPVPKLIATVDHAENIVVHVRDGLIEGLRAEGPARWRKPLDQVNMALSLIAGVTYPANKIHKQYIQDACRVLTDVQANLPE
jgi:hypothetical protein